MAAPWDTNPGWSDSTPVAETGSGVVFGTPGDGKVPTWNAATGRLEWATPSGGSGAVDWITAEANPVSVTVPEGVLTTVTDWAVDAAGGSTVTLDVDGQTFHFAPGIYQYFVGANLGGGLITAANIGFTRLSGTQGSVDWDRGQDFFRANGETSEWGLLRCITACTFQVDVQNTVGGDASLDYVGLDLIRLGDLTPANA